MQTLAPTLARLIEELSKLPSVGRKSAQRLAFHLLKRPLPEALALAQAIQTARETIRECSRCFNYTDAELCPICVSGHRDGKLICVVEKPTDIYAIERGGFFKGVYHVLGGALSPLDGVSPEQLKIKELLERVQAPGVEVILSTSTGTEGDTTALYVIHLLKERQVRVSRLARGLPVGSDLEYMDEITLWKALEGRVEQ